MIEIVGFKRLFLLVIFLISAAALGGVSYGYLLPVTEGLNTDLVAQRARVQQRLEETRQLKEDFQTIEDQQENFENMKLAGYFSNQDRLAVRRRIEDVQSYAGVIQTKFDIGSAIPETNQELEEANHLVLKSDISVKVDAVDDIDLFRFVYWAESGLDGNVKMNNLIIERVKDVNETVLRDIGSGQTPALVRMSMDLEWRTLVDEEKISVSTLGQ